MKIYEKYLMERAPGSVLPRSVFIGRGTNKDELSHYATNLKDRISAMLTIKKQEEEEDPQGEKQLASVMKKVVELQNIIKKLK